MEKNEKAEKRLKKLKKRLLRSKTTRRVAGGTAGASTLVISILWLIRQVSPLPWSQEQDFIISTLVSPILGSLVARFFAAKGVG